MTMTPQELVEHALATSTADDCIAFARVETSANLRWANNTLTTNGVMTGVEVTVIAFVAGVDGIATGSVSGNAVTAAQVEELVRAAGRAAREAEPAEDATDLVLGRVSERWSQPPEETGIEVFADFATALGKEFERADMEGRVLYGFVSHEVATTYLGSTRGLRLRHVQPTGHYGCTGKDATLTRSAWVGGATRDFTDVDAHRLADEVVQRLAWARQRTELPAGRYQTILPPTAVADLMIDAYWGAGARVALEGESVYSRRGGGTRVGERIAKAGVNMWSDPGHQAIQAAPFVIAGVSDNTESVFDNGLELHRTDWIRDGVLTSLVQTRHSARLTEQPVTPGIDNLGLTIDGATGTLSDLVARTERGLLVTCLWYIREVDPQSMLLTGLTRDGVYVVEDGQIAGAVNNFRFNESPIGLLNRFDDCSESMPSFSREWGDDYFSRTITPALRIPDFNMSSVSQGV